MMSLDEPPRAHYTTAVDLFWFGAALPLLGHVLYGLPARDGRVSFHNGDDFSSADQPPKPERLQHVRAVTAGSSTPLEVHGTVDSQVHVNALHLAPPAWIVVETAPVFIELVADSFTRYLEHEGLREVVAARSTAGTAAQPGREVYSKHTKTAISERDGEVALVAAPVGMPIEMVPMVAQPVTVGSRLTIVVLVDGQPAANLQIRAHQREAEATTPREVACLRTNHDGIAAIPIDAPGLWRLHTISMTPHTNPVEADWRSRWASLTFRI